VCTTEVSWWSGTPIGYTFCDLYIFWTHPRTEVCCCLAPHVELTRCMWLDAQGIGDLKIVVVAWGKGASTWQRSTHDSIPSCAGRLNHSLYSDQPAQ
jgi:hypothetical protein